MNIKNQQNLSDYEPMWPDFQPLQWMKIILNSNNVWLKQDNSPSYIIEVGMTTIKIRGKIWTRNDKKEKVIGYDDFKKNFLVAKKEKQSKAIQILLEWKREHPRWWGGIWNNEKKK